MFKWWKVTRWFTDAPIGLKILLAVAIALAMSGAVNRVAAQALQDPPYIYSGAVTVGGQPAPDGYTIHATVGDYRSIPVSVKGGRYEGLVVVVSGTKYDGKTVLFYMNNVQANETDVYYRSGLPVLKPNFNLTFGAPSAPYFNAYRNSHVNAYRPGTP